MTTQPFMGDALSQRPRAKHNKFKAQGVSASTLDAVRVDVSDNLQHGSYTSTAMPGTEFERMRRYALVLAKWSYPNIHKAAKSWKTAPHFVEMANRVVANKQFGDTFRDDPSIDTIYTKPYVSALTSGNITPELISATMSLLGTTSFDQIVEAVRIKDSDIADTLHSHGNHMREYMGYYHDDANGIHRDGARVRRRAKDYYKTLAHLGEGTYTQARRIVDEKAARRMARRVAKPGEQQGAPISKVVTDDGDKVRCTDRVVIPLSDYADAMWQKPYLAKHELVLPHTGMAGRRLIATNEGKYPKAFYRIVTDPYRRIFKRKTRALGGVVVFDCSGSMGLSDDDIKAVMRASAGCSIVCYSADSSDAHNRKYGNIHLVARNGRQARHLPVFPGGNGVDLPALKYAYYNLRLNSHSPVIWVSDGQVTGEGDHSTFELRTATRKFIRSKGIVQVETPDEAVKLLHKLQRKAQS